MSAKFLNNVRVLCKEGCEERFIAATEAWVNPEGMLQAYWAKTGDRRDCYVGIWEREENHVAAGPRLIEQLNSVSDFFDDTSPELGVTESGRVTVITHTS